MSGVLCNGFEKGLDRCTSSRRIRTQCTYKNAACVVCDPNSKALIDEDEIEKSEVEKVFLPNSTGK